MALKKAFDSVFDSGDSFKYASYRKKKGGKMKVKLVFGITISEFEDNLNKALNELKPKYQIVDVKFSVQDGYNALILYKPVGP